MRAFRCVGLFSFLCLFSPRDWAWKGEQNFSRADFWRVSVSVQPKMLYSSSKESLKRSLNGIAVELQANDEDDLEYETVRKSVAKGR